MKIPASNTENCEPLREEVFQLLTAIALSYAKEIVTQEKDERLESVINEYFVVQILKKRIEVLNLPIEIDNAAYLAIVALTDSNPGRAIAILIDALNLVPHAEETYLNWKNNREQEPFKMNIDFLMEEVRPHGTLKEEAFCDYVDNVLKERKINWAEIY